MSSLVGSRHREVVNEAWNAYERVLAGAGPEILVIQAPTGFGKTRVVHEFYAELAASQAAPAYWPTSIVEGSASSRGRAMLNSRKRTYPETVQVEPGARAEWFWWGLGCSRNTDGSLSQPLFEHITQFHAHLEFVQRRPGVKSVGRETLEIGSALIEVSATLGLLVVAPPVSALVSLINAARTAWSRRHWLRGGLSRRSRRRDRTAPLVIDSSGHGRAANVASIASSVVTMSKKIPIILFVEDAHWADSTLVDFLSSLMSDEQARVLVLATAWPETQDEIRPKSFYALLKSEPAWISTGRMRMCPLRELTRSEVEALVMSEIRAVTSWDESDTDDLVKRICDRYGGRPLSIATLFGLARVQRLLKSGELSDTELETFPSELEELLKAYWHEVPDEIQQLLSLGAMAGIKFNRPPIVDAANGLNIPEANQFLDRGQDPYGLIEYPEPDLVEFVEPLLHEIAEQSSHEFFAASERRHAIDKMVEFARMVEPVKHSEEVCRVAWLVHVALAETGLSAKATAVNSCRKLSLLYSRRFGFERSRKYARLAVEWTSEPHQKSEEYREALERLANTEYVLGSFEVSEKIYSEIVARLQSEATVNTPALLANRHNRALCLRSLGQLDLAVIELDGIRRERELLGDRFRREVMNTRHHLVVSRRLAGQFELAEQEGRALLEDQERFLGEKHEDAIASRIEIGRCLFEQRHIEEAKIWFTELSEFSETALGSHPYRWISLGELSRCFAGVGDLSAAIDIGFRVRKGLRNLIGSRHPATLKQSKDLAGYLSESGRREAALEILSEVLGVEESEYGAEDSRVSATRQLIEGLR